jgi:hypothetical protein
MAKFAKWNRLFTNDCHIRQGLYKVGPEIPKAQDETRIQAPIKKNQK